MKALENLTQEGARLVDELADRHGVSREAAATLLQAMAAGGGNQAQFNHAELGGLGQWSRGGMLMIGDMFNHGLKARVAALAEDLATALRADVSALTRVTASDMSASSESGRWPVALGNPASSGSQNDMHYAVFPAMHRLAIERGGQITLYDTADHQIIGFGQQQGDGQSLTLTTQYGLVRVDSLAVVSTDGRSIGELAPDEGGPSGDGTAVAGVHAKPRAAAAEPDGGIVATIEALAGLHAKGILTDDEFSAKKADLLSRL
ncbi:SHOCT domain-containing protein [Sphingobium sp. 3R8]|uniref:SHOCT domain-containing protein n=1 Tax=Sphingobium sp. 3R8 TaxID=2874921 RepID=UPI001CCC64D3|nr:SHOCT domain-containing protein [Sphingobium sp. 3R8]MBZ9650034.1 SHOCT domain-containing protein [Sphingobium sp. 3R8]